MFSLCMCLKIKRTNGFNRGSKRFSDGFNCISNEKDRIDLIFFDNREDKFIVTNKREGVCRQRR